MVMSRGFSLARQEIINILSAYIGVTTADGAVTNDSLVDALLIGATDWITGKTILIETGPAEHQDQGAAAFNPVTGEITVTNAFTNQITAGTIFRVLNISTNEVDVATILAGVTTLLTRLSAARAGYLDELAAANLPTDVAAVLAAVGGVGTDVATLLARLTAARAGYLDELAAANIPADVDTLLARLTDARATNLDSCTYLVDTVPIMMNSTQTLTNAAASKNFIATNTRGGQGLISTVDAKMQKAFLLIIGRAVNTYAGGNALDCSTASHNQWKMNLDGGAYSDLVNGAFADGQMLDNDWLCDVEGAVHPFTFMFDITSQLTNVDGLIGVQLENGRSEQSSLVVTCDIYLKVMWKL